MSPPAADDGPDYDPDGPLRADPDAVAQWLEWETHANLAGFRTQADPVEVEVAWVPRDALEIHVLPGAPLEIVESFLRPDHVCFPRHPLNTDPTVAFFDAPVRERWTARFTSSRTLALPGPESGARLASLKLATDHPHRAFLQPEKTRLREEAVDAVAWVRVIDRIDRRLEPLEGVALVSEVLVVLVRDGESGFMVRDLRLFQDGHYYLPALSIPFVGPQIARSLGADFEALFGEHFAEAVGRAKARLFARYGLWYETPNPQNLLLQLDRDLRPTDTLVFRDVGDGECATDAFTATDEPWTRVTADLRPETETSFWAFGEAGRNSIAADTLSRWYARHDDAYFGELARWFPELASGPEVAPAARLDHWSRALRSDAAAPVIAAAFERFARR
ncbi:MAG TPA: hypothetical protein VKB65_05935 [Myxococcota bacterium]|nr:hypothetical protein [Myxococcota bacterium]